MLKSPIVEGVTAGAGGLNRPRSGAETPVTPAAAVRPVDTGLNAVLSASKLADLSVSDELLAQYKIARNLLHTVEYEEGVPLNQKAQLINSLNTLVGTILKQQSELHNIERLKTLEQVLIETLKAFPDLKVAFLKAYKEALEAQ